VIRDPATHAKNVDEVFGLFKAGKIKPRVTKSFSLDDGAAALMHLESRSATGKVVITP
jgi:NADPH2:quinone reductase